MDKALIAKSKKRAMLVFVGCCLMQMCALGTVLNSSSAYFAYVPAMVAPDNPMYIVTFSTWITFYGIAALVGTFLAGILIPKFGAKLVLSVDIIVSALVMFAFTFMTPEWTAMHFIVLGVILGLFGGQYFIYACPVLIGAWFGKKVMGRYLGIANLFSGIGGALWPQIFTQVFVNASWQSVYYLNAILILLLLAFSLTVFSVHPEKHGLIQYNGDNPADYAVDESANTAVSGVPLKFCISSAVFWILFFAAMLCAFPGSYNSYLQANALEVLGPGNDAFAASIMIYLQLGYIIASGLGGFFIDKFGIKLYSILILVITIITFALWSFVSAPAAMVATAFFFGMNNAAVTIMVPMLVRHHFGQKAYDKVLSYCMMAIGLMGSMGAPVIAFVFATAGSYSNAFLIGAVVAAVDLVLVLLSFVPVKKLHAAHWEGVEEVETERHIELEEAKAA